MHRIQQQEGQEDEVRQAHLVVFPIRGGPRHSDLSRPSSPAQGWCIWGLHSDLNGGSVDGLHAHCSRGVALGFGPLFGDYAFGMYGSSSVSALGALGFMAAVLLARRRSEGELVHVDGANMRSRLRRWQQHAWKRFANQTLHHTSLWLVVGMRADSLRSGVIRLAVMAT